MWMMGRGKKPRIFKKENAKGNKESSCPPCGPIVEKLTLKCPPGSQKKKRAKVPSWLAKHNKLPLGSLSMIKCPPGSQIVR